MPISEDKKLGFVHIPRNGGTYVEHIMGVHRDRPLSGFGENHNHYGDLEHLFGKNMQHLGYADLLKIIGSKSSDFHWFAITRNPEERLISILCHRMKSPNALVSVKSLIGCFYKIIRLWINFYFSNLIKSLVNIRGDKQIDIYVPSIQHLMPQYKYVWLNEFEQKKSPEINIYLFEEINKIHENIPSLDIKNLSGKIPNQSKVKPEPNKLCLKLINIFVKIFYNKDWDLYQKTKTAWDTKNEPLILYSNYQ